VRAGTSICDSAERSNKHPTANHTVGMKAVAISNPFAGRCV
jgi:hypothetical protein